MTFRRKPFDNIMRKKENAVNQHFLLFPQCFLPPSKTESENVYLIPSRVRRVAIAIYLLKLAPLYELMIFFFFYSREKMINDSCYVVCFLILPYFYWLTCNTIQNQIRASNFLGACENFSVTSTTFL